MAPQNGPWSKQKFKIKKKKHRESHFHTQGHFVEFLPLEKLFPCRHQYLRILLIDLPRTLHNNSTTRVTTGQIRITYKSSTSMAILGPDTVINSGFKNKSKKWSWRLELDFPQSIK